MLCAGLPCTNGVYKFVQFKNNAGYFNRIGEWEGKKVNFTLYKCTVNNGGFQWFISITPDGSEPGANMILPRTLRSLPLSVFCLSSALFVSPSSLLCVSSVCPLSLSSASPSVRAGPPRSLLHVFSSAFLSLFIIISFLPFFISLPFFSAAAHRSRELSPSSKVPSAFMVPRASNVPRYC